MTTDKGLLPVEQVDLDNVCNGLVEEVSGMIGATAEQRLALSYAEAEMRNRLASLATRTPSKETEGAIRDVGMVRVSMDNAIAQMAADAIRSSFFTSVSGWGRCSLNLSYPTMEAMHEAEDRLKAFAKHIRFQPLDVRLASPPAPAEAIREVEQLREELACTLEELIDHNGDDMNDSRQKRLAALRQPTPRGDDGEGSHG